MARAMEEGFGLVRELGHTVEPSPVKLFSRLPLTTKAAVIWLATRNASVRGSGAAGIGEARHLIDAMLAAAAKPLPKLQRLRAATTS